MHCKIRLAATCLGLLLCLAAWAGSATAESFSRLELAANRVPWTRLSFYAKRLLVSVTVDIYLESLPTAEVATALIKSPKGVPLIPATPAVYRIMSAITIKPVFRSPVKFTNQVWFNPQDATALGRIRLDRGDDDQEKIFRFTRQGVFRHRSAPADRREALLDPEHWTDVKDSFYAYDLTRLGCSQVSERLILIYLITAVDLSKNREPLSLCVFGKRQLHDVKLRSQGLYPLPADYIAKTAQSEIQKKGPVKALKIAIETRPLGSNLGEVEDFSLLGLHKDIAVFIDPISRLPLQVSGIIPTLGKAELRLREVRLSQGED